MKPQLMLPLAMLALPGVLLAQEPQASGTIHLKTPLMPPVIFTPGPSHGVTETDARNVSTTGALTIGRWTLTTDTAWAQRDPHSQVGARLTFAARGGWRIGGGITGRQQYVMPLVVAQALGSNGLVQEPGSSFFEPVGQAMIWDSQLRFEKVLKSKGAYGIRAVGEIDNPFSSGSQLTPRAVKFGLAITW